MQSITKLALLSIVSATMALTTGCATKRSNTSEIVVAPMGVPGNSVYGNGSLVDNTSAVVIAAENLNSTVYFAFDKSNIDATAATILDQQAAFLANQPSAAVLVAGHTDSRGSREYNMALGERRAQAVKDYLIAKGVSSSRITTISYGEENPAAQGTTEEDYARNRRAVLSYD